MTVFKWFYPGLGIKRWLAVICVGLFLMAEGLAIAQNTQLLNLVEKPLQQLISGYLGNFSGPIGLIVIFFGLIFFWFGFQKLINNILSVVVPDSSQKLGKVLFQKYQLKRGPRIVAVGGGTGLSTLLRGLKEVTGNITAIVTVTDDGGSSGRLRGDLGMPPPGDIRNCLVALADTENAMEDLFNYRFSKDSELAGHNLGNLLLAGMMETTGTFASAVQEASRVLAIRGQVLPVTLDNVILKGEMADGRIVSGETKIVSDEEKIKRVFLEPRNCVPLQEAIQAILTADAIILGPGSLYTSVIPNLLVPGIVNAIKSSQANVYYVCNVMTQPGETDGYKVSHHIKAIIDHCGGNIIDKVIVNSEEISRKLVRKYRKHGSEPVLFDSNGVKELSVDMISGRFSSQTDLARHDPQKLVKVIMDNLQGNG